jgi:hypothetical protein
VPASILRAFFCCPPLVHSSHQSIAASAPNSYGKLDASAPNLKGIRDLHRQ